MDPATGALVAGGITEQTEMVMANLVAVLEAAGCTPANVVKTTCFLNDMGNFGAFNEVYARIFSENAPARSCVAVRTCRWMCWWKWRPSPRSRPPLWYIDGTRGNRDPNDGWDNMVRFTLNGQEVEYDGKPDMTLLRYLRDVAGIKSVKDGCSGQGACGACIIEYNGKPNLSCRLKMEKVDGADVVTLEGVPEETVRFLGEAFVEAGAVQCGFCSPGMLTRTKLLLAKNPDPTRDEVTRKIKPHICRCTGYVKIVDGILNAARAMREATPVAHIHEDSPRKFKAYERAVGEPLFIGGMEMEGMLHGALHFSEHPRARILKIDTSRAVALPGVVRVFTAQDVPGQRKIGMIIKDWDAYIAEGEVTRYIGDVLAMVVAETHLIAREAAALIDVQYEVLEPVTDPFEALKDEIKVHEGGNLLKESKIRYGEDIDKVLEASAHVVGDTFQTQMIEHGFLELENSVACYEDDRLTVYSQGQGIYEDRHQIADLLGLQTSDLNVKLVPAGGAFGGKEDLTVQGHAALAAFLLKCPVKVKLDRTESMRMHPKRHPMTMEYKLGCDADGKFTGLYARIVGDTGAYASVGGPVLERAATHAGGRLLHPQRGCQEPGRLHQQPGLRSHARLRP